MLNASQLRVRGAHEFVCVRRAADGPQKAKKNNRARRAEARVFQQTHFRGLRPRQTDRGAARGFYRLHKYLRGTFSPIPADDCTFRRRCRPQPSHLPGWRRQRRRWQGSGALWSTSMCSLLAQLGRSVRIRSHYAHQNVTRRRLRTDLTHYTPHARVVPTPHAGSRRVLRRAMRTSAIVSEPPPSAANANSFRAPRRGHAEW